MSSSNEAPSATKVVASGVWLLILSIAGGAIIGGIAGGAVHEGMSNITDAGSKTNWTGSGLLAGGIIGPILTYYSVRTMSKELGA